MKMAYSLLFCAAVGNRNRRDSGAENKGKIGRGKTEERWQTPNFHPRENPDKTGAFIE